MNPVNVNPVDVSGYYLDLRVAYVAYYDHFWRELGKSWTKEPWAQHFLTFAAFFTLPGHSWSVLVVADKNTSKPHIATSRRVVKAFSKTLNDRYDFELPNIVKGISRISPQRILGRDHPFELASYTDYHSLCSRLPRFAMLYEKILVHFGEPAAIQNIWLRANKTFIAIDFEWIEGSSECLEFGFTVLQSWSIDLNSRVPIPSKDYISRHYLIEENLGFKNRHCPNKPYKFAFGNSTIIKSSQLRGVISDMLKRYSRSTSNQSNDIVFVAHGADNDVKFVEQLGISLSQEVLIVDTATLEMQLYRRSARPLMTQSGKLRERENPNQLSLTALLRSLGVDIQCTMHNAGNDAYASLLALQLLLEKRRTTIPPELLRETPSQEQVLSAMRKPL